MCTGSGSITARWMFCWARILRWRKKIDCSDVWIGGWSISRICSCICSNAGKDLCDAEFDVLLYDLTSTYVEGEAEPNPKARYGYSRDQRPDGKPVVIALIVTPAGLPLAYEGMAGNTSEKTTVRGFLDRIES